MADIKNLIVGNTTYNIIDDEAIHSAGGVNEGVFWADATATTPEFQIQSKHTNGQELSFRVQDNGWLTLYKLTTADDWSTSTTLFDIPLTTITPTISISSATGVLNSTNIRRFGNVVQLTINVKNSSAIAAGGLLYKGTISTTSLRPKIVVTGGGRNAARHGIGTISTSGVIEIYVSTAWSANAAADFSFTYLI